MAVEYEGTLGYGELMLCFAATYRPASRQTDQRLCLVRWLDTVNVAALHDGRQLLTAVEVRGPFESFRWSRRGGSFANGHPSHGEPHYGLVSIEKVRYRAPIFTGPATPVGAPDPVYRLVEDMMRPF